MASHDRNVILMSNRSGRSMLLQIDEFQTLFSWLTTVTVFPPKNRSRSLSNILATFKTKELASCSQNTSFSLGLEIKTVVAASKEHL